jgi:hypothetical protein
MSSATTHHGRTRLSARRAAALAVVALVVSAAHAASARAQAADPCAGAVGGLVPRPATAFVGQPVTWCFPPAGGAPITNYLWDLDGVAGYEHTTPSRKSKSSTTTPERSGPRWAPTRRSASS